MQDERENLEQFFDSSWQNMHGLLDDNFPQDEKKKERLFIWRLVGLVVAVLFVGWILLPSLMNHKKTDSNQITVVTMTEKSARGLERNPGITIENKPNSKPIKPNSNSEKAQKQSLKATTKLDIPKSIDNSKVTYRKDRNLFVSDRKEVLEKTPIIEDDRLKEGSKIKYLEAQAKSMQAKSYFTPKLQMLKGILVFSKDEAPLSSLPLVGKTKKHYYLNVYGGASISSLDYATEAGGLVLGRSLTSRLALEAGVGYRILNVERSKIGGDGQFLSNLETKINENYQMGSFAPSVDAKQDVQLQLIELPLDLKYDLSPKFSVFLGSVFAHQFKAKIQNDQSNEQLSAQDYFSLSAGVSYTKGRFGLGVGYKNWSFPSPDHHLFAQIRYRLL